MEKDIITIKNNQKSVYEIKKSEFISYAFSVQSVDEVNELLAEVKQKHNDARHICYAYVVNSLEKCSDDGEPSGTAGKPLLDLIKAQSFTNLLLVVVRYFGGIKLGAGGLYRAYLTAGKDVINICEKVKLIKAYQIVIEVPYENEEYILNKLKRMSDKKLTVNYYENVNVCFEVSAEKLEAVKEQLNMLNLKYNIVSKMIME